MTDLLSYIIRKMILAIPVIILATFIVFLMLYITPGDPITSIAPPHASAADLQKLREKYGLDQPFIVQYEKFFVRLLHGDLGQSVGHGTLGTDVSYLIAHRLPRTLELMAIGLSISYSIGIPLGVLAALRQNSVRDRGIMVFTLVAYAMPSFWLGMLLMLAFAVYMHLLPLGGTIGGFSSIILPALTLGLGNAALTTRMMRSSMLEVQRQDFITQLRSKGISERSVVFKHALKNAILPVITVIGLDIGWFVAGAVVVETMFSWPGLGKLVIDSISNYDFPTVQGCILVLAFFVIAGNLFADILYAFADPRVRLG
jgi:peptide/nickel transport system permease protein